MVDLHFHYYSRVFGMPLAKLHDIAIEQDKERLLELYLFKTSQALNEDDLLAASQAFNTARFLYDRIKEERTGA